MFDGEYRGEGGGGNDRPKPPLGDPSWRENPDMHTAKVLAQLAKPFNSQIFYPELNCAFRDKSYRPLTVRIKKENRDFSGTKLEIFTRDCIYVYMTNAELRAGISFVPHASAPRMDDFIGAENAIESMFRDYRKIFPVHQKIYTISSILG